MLSEPEAGSDATSQKTTAEDKGDYYIFNGMKNWITNGNSASVYLVIAQTDVAKAAEASMLLLLKRTTPGVTVGAKENKLGIRGSDTHSISFNDVIVPKKTGSGKTDLDFNLL